MSLEQLPRHEQLSLNFDTTPEDTYRQLPDNELLAAYTERVRVPLKPGRYVLQNGEYDRESIIQAILNSERERDALLAEEREEDDADRRRPGFYNN